MESSGWSSAAGPSPGNQTSDEIQLYSRTLTLDAVDELFETESVCPESYTSERRSFVLPAAARPRALTVQRSRGLSLDTALSPNHYERQRRQVLSGGATGAVSCMREST